MPHQCTNCSHVFPDGSKAMLSGCPDCGGNTFQFLPKGAIPSDDADGASDTSSGEVPVESAEPGESTDPAASADPTEQPPERSPSRGPVSRATAAVREWVRADPPFPTPRPDDATRADPIDGEVGDDAVRDAGRDDEIEDPDGDIGNDAVDSPTAESPSPIADSPTGSTGSDGDDIAGEERSPSDVQGDATDAIGPGTEDRAQADARRDVVADDELDSAATDRASSEHLDAANADARTPPSGVEGGRIAAEPSADRPDLDELRRELNDQFESIKIVAPGQYELNLMELYNREEYIIALREDGRYAIEAPETWLGRRADRD